MESRSDTNEAETLPKSLLKYEQLLDASLAPGRPVEELSECLSELLELSVTTDTVNCVHVALLLKRQLKNEKSSEKLISSFVDALWLYDIEVLPGVRDEAEKEGVSQRLVQLVKEVLQSLPKELLFTRLDCSFLERLGVTQNGELLNRKIARANTSLLYRQHKFNLLREENEGFSKLIVELDNALHYARDKSVDQHTLAEVLVKDIQVLVGTFNLDGSKVLDIVLSFFAENIVHQHDFLIDFLNASRWKAVKPPLMFSQLSVEQRQKLLSELLVSRCSWGIDSSFLKISSQISQLLGHNLAYFYEHLEDTPFSYNVLIALLIKNGFFGVDNIWPYLSPSDEEVSTAWAKHKDSIEDEIYNAKGNPLSMAAPLPDEEVEDGEALMDTEMTEAVDTPPPKPSQKLGLLKALLAIGDLKSSLLILGRFPVLLQVCPEAAKLFLKLVHIMVRKIYVSIDFLGKLSPDMQDRLQQPKLVPEDSRVREIKLTLPKTKKQKPVLNPYPVNPTGDVFFYEERLSEDLPILETMEQFYGILVPLLKLPGVHFSQDPLLFTKICRIGVCRLKSHPEERERWIEICRIILLPSLTLIPANVGIINEFSELFFLFSVEERYSLYGEWSTTTMKRIPDLKLQNFLVEKEAKGILRRLTKTNVKQFVIVEASRYLTKFGFDALTYATLAALSNSNKQRLKSDGTSIAQWLQGLASFCGRLFRYYTNMDPTIIFRYCIKRLKQNQMFDLIVLRDLLVQMSGMQPWTNLSDNQLLGAAGGKLMRHLSLSLIYEKPSVIVDASSRLLQVLKANNLTGQLLILLAQKLRTCIYNVEEQHTHLKLIGNLYDDCSDVLFLLVEFLSFHCTPGEYASMIPKPADMLEKFHLDPPLMFFLYRYAVEKPWRVYSLQNNKRSDDADEKMQVDDQIPNATPSESSVVKEAPMSDDQLSLESFIQQPHGLFPANTWAYISPSFYTIFWNLSIYDIYLPFEHYESERNRLVDQMYQVGAEKEASQLKFNQKRIEKQKLFEISGELQSELKEHMRSLESTRKYLHSKSDYWFLPSGTKVDGEQLDRPRWNAVDKFWSLCIAPRLRLSPHDAIFCAKFVKLLHSLNTWNFSTMSLLDILFGPQLPSLIFSFTQREAANFSRFLFEILAEITAWHKDPGLYERDCLGNGHLVGFVLEWNETKDDGAVDPSRLLRHNRYLLLVSKWHKQLTMIMEKCLLSGDYMHIYNSIVILERILPFFPLIEESGRTLKSAAEKLKDNEQREDLKVLALGYYSKLAKKEATWVSFHSFSGTVKPKSTKVEEKPKKADPSPMAVEKDVEEAPAKKTSSPVKESSTTISTAAAHSAATAPATPATVDEKPVSDTKPTPVPPKQTTTPLNVQAKEFKPHTEEKVETSEKPPEATTNSNASVRRSNQPSPKEGTPSRGTSYRHDRAPPKDSYKPGEARNIRASRYRNMASENPDSQQQQRPFNSRHNQRDSRQQSPDQKYNESGASSGNWRSTGNRQNRNPRGTKYNTQTNEGQTSRNEPYSGGGEPGSRVQEHDRNTPSQRRNTGSNDKNERGYFNEDGRHRGNYQYYNRNQRMQRQDRQGDDKQRESSASSKTDTNAGYRPSDKPRRYNYDKSSAGSHDGSSRSEDNSFRKRQDGRSERDGNNSHFSGRNRPRTSSNTQNFRDDKRRRMQ
ncbi:THO complex subunit Tho2 [Schizosaccharomyces japonicus yFS275]|uniref:THO complex subunit 2 n=1 Tax=Schizosaccharomyces japonicus (strain yFS275 / FY16936) TaxID=402676 RepID=B6JX64_SCHJY|nr:THO complex subunit Tho2 [Schizosaccharomyces japonicus yFS275]EEB05965.2 THO complex subunit Tho2 [Schizosaccharomyces japonicus yFS275]